MHHKLYFRFNPYDKKWIYIDIFGWQPFGFYQHSGWFYLNKSWVARYLSVGIKRTLVKLIK